MDHCEEKPCGIMRNEGATKSSTDVWYSRRVISRKTRASKITDNLRDTPVIGSSHDRGGREILIRISRHNMTFLPGEIAPLSLFALLEYHNGLLEKQLKLDLLIGKWLERRSWSVTPFLSLVGLLAREETKRIAARFENCNSASKGERKLTRYDMENSFSVYVIFFVHNVIMSYVRIIKHDA